MRHRPVAVWYWPKCRIHNVEPVPPARWSIVGNFSIPNVNMFAVTSFTGPSGSLARNANIKVIRCREMVVLWALLSIKLYNIWFYQHAITLLQAESFVFILMCRGQYKHFLLWIYLHSNLRNGKLLHRFWVLGWTVLKSIFSGIVSIESESESGRYALAFTRSITWCSVKFNYSKVMLRYGIVCAFC